jgi:hypothetical protein
MLDAQKQLAMVLFRELRPDQNHAREMDLARGDQPEQHRKLPGDSGSTSMSKCRVLRHAELVNAEGAKACASALPIDAARLDLGEVCEQRCELMVRASDATARPSKQFGIREMRKSVGRRRHVRIGCIHVEQHTPRFFVLQIRAECSFRVGS